jgi:hypothetical protein
MKIWRVPPKAMREGSLLLDQQCWCWGQDIRHESGNLLLERGFVRERSITDKDLSRYTLLPPTPSSQPWEEGGRIVLWAFGLFYDGLWLLRKDFKIRLAPSETAPDIWTVRDAEMQYPTTEEEGERLREKLRAACLWIAEYEENIPLKWRAETLRRWDKKSIPAAEQAAHWRSLEETLR